MEGGELLNESAVVVDHGNVSCSTQYLIDETWIRGLIILFYLFIFVLGVVGNVLVILVVVKERSMQSPTNIFIVNLAIGDVLMCLFAVPFTPLHSFMDEWVFGDVLCKIFPSSQGASVYMSTLTLTCIAVDRYAAVVHPYRARMSNATAVRLALAVNLVALLCTAPYFFHMVVREDHDNEESELICTEEWPAEWEWSRPIYGAFINISQFVLPFTTILFCYSVIMVKLSHRMSSRPGASRRSAAKEEAEKERKKKTNRLCVSMVVIFGTCWFPTNFINFLNDVRFAPMSCWHYYHFVFFLCHVLAMSSNCYNPFLYGWLNDAFRREFLKLLPPLATLCHGNSDADAAAAAGNGRRQTLVENGAVQNPGTRQANSASGSTEEESKKRPATPTTTKTTTSSNGATAAAAAVSELEEKDGGEAAASLTLLTEDDGRICHVVRQDLAEQQV